MAVGERKVIFVVIQHIVSGSVLRTPNKKQWSCGDVRHPNSTSSSKGTHGVSMNQRSWPMNFPPCQPKIKLGTLAVKTLIRNIYIWLYAYHLFVSCIFNEQWLVVCQWCCWYHICGKFAFKNKCHFLLRTVLKLGGWIGPSWWTLPYPISCFSPILLCDLAWRRTFPKYTGWLHHPYRLTWHIFTYISAQEILSQQWVSHPFICMPVSFSSLFIHVLKQWYQYIIWYLDIRYFVPAIKKKWSKQHPPPTALSTTASSTGRGSWYRPRFQRSAHLMRPFHWPLHYKIRAAVTFTWPGGPGGKTHGQKIRHFFLSWHILV